MRHTELIIFGLTLVGLVNSSPYPHHRLYKRYEYDAAVKDSYDFIIVGGGLAGLVLASRLSEDSNTTVLVLEAGDSGEAVQTTINTPAYTYYNSLIGSSYDYAFKTIEQSGAGNRAMSWPRGKLLGGSSAVNGMYLVRPSEIEVNAWKDLIAEDDAASAENWSWESLLAAMKKSETFTPPSDAIKTQAAIQWDTGAHGSNGPLHYSYPGYEIDAVGDWTATLASAGIGTNGEAGWGKNGGAFIATSAINPTNWTRSYSRNAYIDPLPPRSNLDIAVNATTTRILFSSGTSNLTATGVEFASGRGASTTTVKANKEVILSGGVIGSPQLLMVSGVGPKDVLEAAGVEVRVELPGVGQHLQDHLSTTIVFSSSVETGRKTYSNGGSLAQSPEFLSYVNSATAYINMTFLLGTDGAASFQTNVNNMLSDASSSLVPSKYPEVVEGYKAIYQSLAKQVTQDVGQIEFLLNTVAFADGVSIGTASQHPFSQGRLYINTSSVFDTPVIDPSYLSHSADIDVLREGLKQTRLIAQNEPLASLLGDETSPGSGVQTDEQWNDWIKNNFGTEYHPSSSCSMLPRSKGGVVNAKLQVYGTSNLRVVDSSVFPFAFSCHLMAPTYGLAEQAATMIRAQYNAGSSSSDSGSGSSGGGGSDSNTTPNGVAAIHPHVLLQTLILVLLFFI